MPEIWAAIGVSTTLLAGFMVYLATQLQSVGQRVDALDTKFTQRFEAMDAKFTQRFEAMDTKFAQRFEAMDAKFTQRFEAMTDRQDRLIEMVAHHEHP